MPVQFNSFHILIFSFFVINFICSTPCQILLIDSFLSIMPGIILFAFLSSLVLTVGSFRSILPTIKKIKIKCTLVKALRLCTGRTAHRGNRGIALLFLDHGTRRGWGVSATPRPLLTPGKDPVHIVQEAGWAPRPVWTGAENLASTGIRSPDRPARSQSLYRLNYPGPPLPTIIFTKFFVFLIFSIFLIFFPCFCSSLLLGIRI